MKMDWLHKIASLRTAVKMEHINKGFSEDEKYKVTLKDGEQVLLRVAGINEYVRKKEEFHILKEFRKLDVRSPKPIEVGKLEEMDRCYLILSYIEGEDGYDALPQLTESEQYEIGKRAGRDLRNMHQHPAPEGIDSWYDTVMKKYYRYLEAYKTCGIKIKNDEYVLSFVEKNKGWLKSRPNMFQHDDFHPSNLIIKDKKYEGVIDFNRFDWGDPYHDFCKTGLFSREVSVPFCRGQIDGYFDEEEIPDDFWMGYALYMAMNVLSAIVWTTEMTEVLVNEMINRLNQVMEDHQNFELLVPKWFVANSIIAEKV